jgi:antitoxin YefM
MYTLYRVNADDLDDALLQSIKTLFRGRTIEIAVSETADAGEDDTAYLLRGPANRERLLNAIKRAEQGDVVVMDLDDLGQAS